MKGSYTSSPSQQQLSALLELYQNGNFPEAEKPVITITQKFPRGTLELEGARAGIKSNGRFRVIVRYKNIDKLAPQDVEGHSNLGATLKKLGRLDDAVESYTRALALNRYSRHTPHNEITLKELGRLDESEASYKSKDSVESWRCCNP